MRWVFLRDFQIFGRFFRWFVVLIFDFLGISQLIPCFFAWSFLCILRYFFPRWCVFCRFFSLCVGFIEIHCWFRRIHLYSLWFHLWVFQANYCTDFLVSSNRNCRIMYFYLINRFLLIFFYLYMLFAFGFHIFFGVWRWSVFLGLFLLKIKKKFLFYFQQK